MAKLAAEMREEQERLGSLQPRDIRRPVETRDPGTWQVAPDDPPAEPGAKSWNWAELIVEERAVADDSVPPRLPAQRLAARRSSGWILSLAAVAGAFVGVAGAWLMTGATPFDLFGADSAPTALSPVGLSESQVAAPAGGKESADSEAHTVAAASSEATTAPASAGFAARLADAQPPSAPVSSSPLPRSAAGAAVDAPAPLPVKAKGGKFAVKVPRPKPRPAALIAAETSAPIVAPQPVEPFPPAAMAARSLVLKASRDNR
jgi:hypothetical protein